MAETGMTEATGVMMEDANPIQIHGLAHENLCGWIIFVQVLYL